LILPKQHFRDLLLLPSDHAGPVMEAAQVVAGALVRSLDLEGFNMFSNNGAIAGQSVFHFHIHITPRFPNDMIRFAHGQKSYAGGEMSEYGSRIRACIQPLNRK
jgi:histidine triad (HIT) family protein